MSKKIVSQSVINSTKTSRPTTNNLNREWYIVDASKKPLGRVASVVANLITGKNKANFSQDIDMGAVVVVINTKDIVLTGAKSKWKTYFMHNRSGATGALRSKRIDEVLESDPNYPIWHAVRGMLPKNRMLSDRLANRLKLFPSDVHPFTQKMTQII
jgi:large subunit ribosomal protein L13